MNNGLINDVALRETMEPASRRTGPVVRFFDWLLTSLSRVHRASDCLPADNIDHCEKESPPATSRSAAHYAWSDRTGGPMATGGLCGALSRMC